MGMKHILRALNQALEAAEIERKYLRDALEAERVEKQRLAAELDKLLATFRARERDWAGEREDMDRRLRDMRREKERMQGAVDSLESENAKLREALEKWKNCC